MSVRPHIASFDDGFCCCYVGTGGHCPTCHERYGGHHEHDPSRPARLVAKNLLTIEEANEACCCMAGYNGCCGQCHNSCERCEGVGKLNYGAGPTCDNCEGSGIGQGPVGCSQRELQQIVEAHEAINPQRRMMHNPPKIEIPQHCMECGQDMEPIVVGWDLLREAAEGDDGLPVRVTTICNGCHQKEAN